MSKSSGRSTPTRRSTARRATARTTTRTSANGRSRSSNGSSRKQKDIIALLKEDHREVEQMFRRFSKLGDRAGKSKRSLVRDLVKELSKHAAAEEQLLYPTIAEAVAGGKRMMNEGIDEHQEVKELLADLDKMAPDDEEFDVKVQSLIENVRHHVKEEETEMFPKLRTSVDRNRLTDLGRMLEMAKKVAPTRPHPRAPSTPPANIVVGAVSGVVDRVRDVGRSVLKGE